jgi:hypothetical protein
MLRAMAFTAPTPAADPERQQALAEQTVDTIFDGEPAC